MQLTYSNLNFKDFMNMSNPMSLEKFARSNGIHDIKKGIYPYELYEDVKQLKNATTFPAFETFKSSLKNSFDKSFLSELKDICHQKFSSGEWTDISQIGSYYGFSADPDDLEFENGVLILSENIQHQLAEILHVSPKDYEESKSYFESHCHSMIDFLKFYNNLDTELLQKSIDIYTKGFYNDWGINIHRFMSLPGVAEKLAFKNYPDHCAPIYSFGDKFEKIAVDVRRYLFKYQ